MFVLDAPGPLNIVLDGARYFVEDFHAVDYVRVGIEGNPAGDNESGSRASQHLGWHVYHTLDDNFQAGWRRTTGDQQEVPAVNEVATGLITLGNFNDPPPRR